MLESTYPNKRIIVADNASTDDSINFLKKQFNTVEVMALNKNYGFSEGYNEALKKIEADYYILLNSDVEVSPNWIEPVLILMISDKKIAACQPKIMDYHHKDYFEYAGAAGDGSTCLGILLPEAEYLILVKKIKHSTMI